MHTFWAAAVLKNLLTLSQHRYSGLLEADSEREVRHNLFLLFSLSLFYPSFCVSYRTQKRRSRYTLLIYSKLQTSVFISYWQAHLKEPNRKHCLWDQRKRNKGSGRTCLLSLSVSILSLLHAVHTHCRTCIKVAQSFTHKFNINSPAVLSICLVSRGIPPPLSL